MRHACVDAKGNEACQRGDGRAESPYVGSRQQRVRVVGEIGEHDGGGNVAYDLAGESGGQHFASRQDAANKG